MSNVLLVILTAGMLSLASPVFSIEYFTFIFLIPWIVALNNIKSLKGSFFLGSLLSLSYVALIQFWVPTTLINFFDFSNIQSWLYFVLAAPLIQGNFIIFSMIYFLLKKKKIINNSISSIVGVSLLYASIDFLIPKIFFDTLGHAFYNNYRIITLSSYIGAIGLTFIIVFINFLFYNKKIKSGVFCIFLLYGLAFINQKYNMPDIKTTKKITIYQPKFTLLEYKVQSTKYFNKLNMKFDKIKTHYKSSDIIVFPETFLPNDLNSQQYVYFKEKLKKISKELNNSIFIGGKIIQNNIEYNVTFNFFKGKEYILYKEELFPFGEYIPFESLKDFFPKTSKLGIKHETKLLKNNELNILNLICYETINTKKQYKIRKKIDLIINPTNEIWFSNEGKYHTEAVSRFRSSEFNTVLLRSALNGSSGVYIPYLKAKKLNMNLDSELTLQIPIYKGQSIYQKFNPIVKYLLSIVVLFYLFFYFKKD